MNWESWFCLGTLIMLLITLVRNRIPTDAVMVFALTLIVGVGAVTGSPKLPDAARAVSGFGKPVWSKRARSRWRGKSSELPRLFPKRCYVCLLQ